MGVMSTASSQPYGVGMRLAPRRARHHIHGFARLRPPHDPQAPAPAHFEMNSNRITTSLIASLFIHAALVVSILWWSLHNANLLGGGGGIVEVAVVGDGSNSVSLRAPAKQSHGIASAHSELPNDATTPSPLALARQSFGGGGEGQGEGGAGGSGEGVGSGTGPGDPRLVTIWKKINRAKYYPEMARRQGVEGAPKVAFSISEDGKVGGVKVVESSGNEILDNAAVEAIENSAPLPFYPKPITIAVRYSLKNR